MDFKDALESMKAGNALALPEWGGYWLWDGEGKTIQMHCKDGSIVDMRDSPDMEFTLSHMFRDDWVVLTDPKDTEHYRSRLGSAQTDYSQFMGEKERQEAESIRFDTPADVIECVVERDKENKRLAREAEDAAEKERSNQRCQTCYEIAKLYTNFEAQILHDAVFDKRMPSGELLVAAQQGRREWDEQLRRNKVSHPDWRPRLKASANE